MRVLQLCHKPAKPAKDGGCIAINNISEGLLQLGVDLKILTLSTHKHPFKKENYSAEFLKATEIDAVYVETKVNIVDAFSNLVTSDSYNISRFFSTDFDRMLRTTLEEEDFDVVHLESLFMTTYAHTIRSFSKAKIVLRSHNLEYMIWERMARQQGTGAKKIYLTMLAKQLKKYEQNVFESIDGIASITEEDAEKYRNIGCKKPIEVIPFGIPLARYHYKTYEKKEINCFHLGSMDWKPNLEAVSWFLEDVWEDVNQRFPEMEFHLAGRNMPNWLVAEDIKNVINHEEVASADDFMNSHAVMVVPLLSAGGMRVKIIEGMALGKVVISTSVGAEGINYTDGEDILIANNKAEFIEKLAMLKSNPDQLEIIGKNARNLVEKYYDNEIIIRDLYSLYVGLVS